MKDLGREERGKKGAMSRQWRELGLLTNGTEVAGGRGATCCRNGGCEITIFSVRASHIQIGKIYKIGTTNRQNRDNR